MAILSTNQRLINVGDSYSAGNGIDITNNIISVTGDNAPYSAGDNIDIQDHIISGKDWSNDIEQASANAYNVTTAWVQDNYANSADMTYISAMVDTKLDTSAWSSVSGDLATESYVIMADNITYDRAKGYVDSKGYATEEFVNENTSGKLDSSSFASVSSDFLTTAFGISESGAWNEATNCVENNSAAWFDNQGDVEVNELVYAQSANWNEVSSKLDSTAFDTWQQGQYTNDIAGLNNLIGTKLDASSFEETSGTFYPTSNPSGFITGVDLSNYYQKNETSSKEEISAAIAAIPLGDEEVNQVVHTNSSTWNTVTDKLDTTAQVISSYTTASIEGTSLVVSLNDKPLNAYRAVSAQEAGIADKAKYDYDGNNLVDDHNSLTALSNFVQSNSGTIDDAVTTYQSNSANYITAHQSLEGLMSASLLESADGKWTAYNSIPFKAGDEFPASADEAIQAYQTNSSTYLTAHQSLDGLMSANLLEFNAENHISSYNGSAFEDSSPTLPMTGRDGVDVQMDNGTLVLSSTLYETVTTNSAQWNQKLDTNVFTAWSANQAANDYQLSAGIGVSIVDDDINKITRIDVTAGGGGGGDMYTTYLEYNNQNQISGYAGSAFAVQGGGGNPEVENYVQTNSANIDETVTSFQTNSSTYMVEPNLEYNAVNEISGYNGSAIAQYGAEKQWLVHDGTLCHLSNSAQYALGVNVSALQRLMGIDETVIYENATGATVNSANVITLNESLQNFEMIKIIDNSLNVGGCKRLTTIPVSTATRSIATNDAWFDVSYNPTSNASKYVGVNFYSANDAGTQIRMNGSYITHMDNTGKPAQRNDGHLYKIIGIHRISG